MKNQRRRVKSRMPAATYGKSLAQHYQKLLRLREAVKQAEKKASKRAD